MNADEQAVFVRELLVEMQKCGAAIDSIQNYLATLEPGKVAVPELENLKVGAQAAKDLSVIVINKLDVWSQPKEEAAAPEANQDDGA